MMTKTDYALVGDSLKDLPISAKLMVYRRLCNRLGARNPEFDPFRFGATMGIPPLFRLVQKFKNTTENEVEKCQ